jgi:hypothetical protein
MTTMPPGGLTKRHRRRAVVAENSHHVCYNRQMSRGRLRWTILVGVALLPLQACSTARPDVDAAAVVAETFATRVTAGNGQAACDLLSPAAAQSVAEQAGEPCPQAITGMPLRVSSTVDHVAAFGRSAQAHYADSVVFLSRFDEGWRIFAVGCRPEPNRPYECAVQAG